ncbi:MAG: hypothetical protein MZV70_52900 [Desulfobacterales bacterium]|nr:hypothetical protein [Desulfobacterales bacterium]
MIELLAGIPSVVYGFIGVVILVPFIRETFGGPGLSVLAASIILGIMILPTIISISVDSLQAVPPILPGGLHRPGRHALADGPDGPLPAARSGIIASIILGMGRAIGETMAVIMVAGNAAERPQLDPRPGPDADLEHRPGDGLRGRRAPSGPLRHGRHPVRHHHDPEHRGQRDGLRG